MNTNNAERLRNEIPVSGSVPENFFSHYRSEVDNNESNPDYQTRVVRVQLNGQTTSDSIDLNIPLIDPSLEIIEFYRSFFTIWLNFRIYVLSMGRHAGIPVESDGLPAWIDHFSSDLPKTNTKLYKNPTCINISKNKFIFTGYKNSTDCFSQIMIKCRK
jgi:hypothetical protein